MSKALSGRWILTVISGLVFAYCAVNKVLTPEAIATILTMVFISYFQKNDHSKENGNEHQG